MIFKEHDGYVQLLSLLCDTKRAGFMLFSPVSFAEMFDVYVPAEWSRSNDGIAALIKLVWNTIPSFLSKKEKTRKIEDRRRWKNEKKRDTKERSRLNFVTYRHYGPIKSVQPRAAIIRWKLY